MQKASDDGKVYIKQVSRYGSYGVIRQGLRLLFVLKRAGPYQGLWDLVGGKIEFGESPEEALKRELAEETALEANYVELLSVACHVGAYEEGGEPYEFHHIGIVYIVEGLTPISSKIAQETLLWAEAHEVQSLQLTPLASQAMRSLALRSEVR